MEIRIIKDEPQELSFEIIGGEVSLPQLLVEKLNADKSVEFAACKLAHPLVVNPSIIVRTARGKPVDAVVKALKEISAEVSAFRDKFSEIVG